jgi:hypothetical protein
MDDDWRGHFRREVRRYRDGRRRLGGDERRRERQLMRIGSAAWGAGLAVLMLGQRDPARDWLLRAAAHYRDSVALAPPGVWGRYIGALKSRIIMGDARADDDAARTLAAGAARSESPIGRYAACLATRVHRDDAAALSLSESLVGEQFPAAVAASLRALATGSGDDYEQAVRAVLFSFERRDRYLEDVPVADTAIVLQLLAAARGIAVPLASPLLPGVGVDRPQRAMTNPRPSPLR